MGTPAAAEFLEEAALPQGGEGSSPDSTDAGEGHLIDKKQEVRGEAVEQQVPSAFPFNHI